ncbi:hypothetical protein [Mesorhizobium sp. SP-1A]|uniref:hypothetical protein n=1 Tax=Mesorhizobium sp. SP-1A TaxID=3077840 RepID=UPI0028F6FABB|nr:hypothetical protein [Mesorhizobium sp. SP-1A]
MSDTVVVQSKPKRERSPSFPFIPLQQATKRLQEFEATFGRHPAPAKHTGGAWGMKGWTSQAQQTLAALKAFGLVEYSGSSKDLTAAITDDGRTYLRAQQDSVKAEVLKRVALKPKIIAKYFAEWGADRPPDAVCLDRLVLKDGFTEGAAKLFLSVYDSTIAYAGLSDSDKGDDAGASAEDDTPPSSRAKVGDYVLIEVDGAFVFKEPKRVEEIQELDGVEWVFVEGETAAVQMEQVTVQPAPLVVSPPPVVASGATPPTRTLPTLPSDWSEEILIDDGGEEIKIQYRGEPSLERYEFIRDYLAFKIGRLEKMKQTKG